MAGFEYDPQLFANLAEQDDGTLYDHYARIHQRTQAFMKRAIGAAEAIRQLSSTEPIPRIHFNQAEKSSDLLEQATLDILEAIIYSSNFSFIHKMALTHQVLVEDSLARENSYRFNYESFDPVKIEDADYYKRESIHLTIYRDVFDATKGSQDDKLENVSSQMCFEHSIYTKTEFQLFVGRLVLERGF